MVQIVIHIVNNVVVFLKMHLKQLNLDLCLTVRNLLMLIYLQLLLTLMTHRTLIQTLTLVSHIGRQCEATQ